ncbi:UNVERIFIED_CONTAM: hypothetical protein GTU68_033091, partial [Idotea baltica]|nr:hypothetical protein [Idotea baltica]
FGLYIHIPFCTKKCPYCDFNTYAVKNIPEEEYTNALLIELENAKQNKVWSNREVNTIYFGGGTPSIFNKLSIEKILNKVNSCFSVSSDAEITLEANPGDLTFSDLASLKEANINRLSFGVQTLNDFHLKSLGRWHDSKQAMAIFNDARRTNFKNINLDLMFSLPEQKIEDLEDDLNKYIELNPEHISTYELTIEKGTPFFSRYKTLTKPLPDETINYDMYSLIIEKLTNNNFSWYEVSNFGKKGYLSKHNTSYWKNKDYLGIGAGAHSFYKNDNNKTAFRSSNIANIDDYLKAKKINNFTAWSEELNQSKIFNELIALSLRTQYGISIKKLANFVDLNKLDNVLNDLKNEKLIEIIDNKIITTQKGRYLADSVASAIIDFI